MKGMNNVEANSRSPLRRLPRNVWVMSATSLLNDISSEMLLNLIPFFLANILGVRTAVIGLIEGVAETTASLLKIYFGALSDRYGKRKPFAVVGYALSALTKPLLYFASAWGWVLSVRVADRIGKGIRDRAARRPDRRTRSTTSSVDSPSVCTARPIRWARSSGLGSRPLSSGGLRPRRHFSQLIHSSWLCWSVSSPVCWEYWCWRPAQGR